MIFGVKHKNREYRRIEAEGLADALTKLGWHQAEIDFYIQLPKEKTPEVQLGLGLKPRRRRRAA